MRRLIAVLAVAAALGAAPSALAGYPVQPGDGSTVDPQPTFLVYLDDGETLPLIQLSSSPEMSGASAVCSPSTPWQEPHKFTCQPVLPLAPGTYYWALSYWKDDDCYTLFNSTYCGPQRHLAGPYRIVVQAAPPDASFSASATQVVNGDPLTFEAHAAGAGTYDWDFGDGTTVRESLGITSHSYASPGRYTVRLAVTSEYGTQASQQLTVTVGAAADAAFTASATRVKVGGQVLFRGEPGFSDYSWDFGDDATDETAVPSTVHEYDQPGSYTATLTVTDASGGEDTQTLDVEVVPPPPPDGATLPTRRGPSSASRKDPGYSQIVSKLAHGARVVFCWDASDWSRLTSAPEGEVDLGFVDRRKPRQVNFSPEVCRSLDNLFYRHQRPAPNYVTATAVDTLVHETIHTLGIHNEATTECYAMQTMAGAAKTLGLGLAYGEALARIRSAHYSAASMPTGYWSPLCRNGGALDLFKNDNGWPTPQGSG